MVARSVLCYVQRCNSFLFSFFLSLMAHTGNRCNATHNFSFAVFVPDG